ncbi:Uncharacterised protein [Klebsiella pneumoniae]|nr:Uncharacterised protein [Klebsiella pneumoniae]
MSIDYNTIMTSSSEEVEEYINRNHFTDKQKLEIYSFGNDSNLLIVFYVQIMPDDFVMQLHRF